MAVLWQTGFDFLDTGVTPLFEGSGGTALGGPVERRFQSGAYYAHNYQRISSSGIASAWVHAHISFSDTDTQIGFNNDTIEQVTLHINAANVIEARRGTVGGTILGAGTTILKWNTWYAITAEVTISDTVGVVKVWVNGNLEINLTGQDTLNSGAATVTRLHWASSWVGYFDNIVAGDSTAPTTELRVDAMMPDGAGTDATMTRSEGATDYGVVDDALTNTTDYLYADAIGEKTSLSVEPLTNAGGTIVAVQVSVYAAKNDAGACGFKIYLLSNGTRYYSVEFFPSFGSWTFFQKVWNLHPYPSDEAWTEADFNACEFGVERTT